MNQKTTSGKKNIVWLTQDHVIWKHYRDTDGPKPSLPTFDRLAANGVCFNRAYSVTPLCTPARASMLTGVYPHNHGITRNDNKSWRNEFDSEMKLFNMYLRQNGYRTALFGKWHAGKGIPQDFGFEGFSMPGYGNPYRSEEYASYLEERNLPDPVVDVEWDIVGSTLKDINMKDVVRFAGTNPNGFRSGSAGVMKAPAQTAESFFVSQLACDWLEQRAEDGDSFVLKVDVWGPHQPYLVTETFKNTIDPKSIPEYPNFSNSFEDRPEYHKKDRKEWRERTGITSWEDWQPIMARAYEHLVQTDSALYKVLETLDKTGLADNTIVIYTADHGDIIGSNGGLFDKDSMLTEETMTIPLVIQGPGVNQGRRASDALVLNMDIVPTVLNLAGIDVPAHMDGTSLVPLLHEKQDDTWREDMMAEHFGHKNHDEIQRVLFWKNYKYVAHLNDSDELYELDKDPFELKNRIDHPSLSSVLTEMKSRLAKCMKQFDDQSKDSKILIHQKQMN